MNLKHLLTKALLVVAMLGGGTGASWADSKLSFYSNDFSASNSLDLITVSATANQTLELATEDGRGYYVRQTTQDRARDMYMNLTTLLAESSFADYTDYVVEFDAAFRSGATNRTTGNKLYLPSTGSTNIFYMATPETQVNTGDLVFTVTGAAEGKEITLTSLTWYHFKFEITATQVTYTVTKASDGSAVTNGTGTLTITDSRIKQIYFGTARSAGQSRLDNVDIYTTIAGDVANAPTVTETAVLSSNRQYTITFGDGETLHYTLPGGTEQTSTTSPVVVTTTEAGTLNAYTTKGTATSSAVNVTVTSGAISLNEPTYTLSSIAEGYGKTYTVSINNNSVELQPTATMSYVFTPAGGSAQDAVAIANGGKITATVAGTYVVTAIADGYTSSSLTINNNQAYAKTKSFDFAALTVDELDLTTPKWTGPSTTNYQTSSNSTLFSADGYTVVSEYASNSAIEGVNLNAATVLMIGYGLHPNGNSGGFSLAGLNSDDLVLWSYYDYANVTEYVGSYDAKVTGNGNHWRYLVTKAEVFSPLPATVSKTITSAGWATYCSPYALDFSSAITNLDAAYIVTGGSNGVLTKTAVTGTVPANTGLLLKGSEGTVTIPVAASGTTDVKANIMTGVTTATEIAAEAGWVLMASPSLGFYKNTNTFTVGANTAYILTSKLPAPARKYFSLFADEATGIANVSENVDDDTFVDLSGRRVAQPTKGLYIVNGKKVLVK